MTRRASQDGLSRTDGMMSRKEWIKTATLIGLLVIAILFAQSRRNCEVPGSTWIPCIYGKALKEQPDIRKPHSAP
jgi:hypothetical protein